MLRISCDETGRARFARASIMYLEGERLRRDGGVQRGQAALPARSLSSNDNSS
jgi:hypothetical protein